ncbi:MAG: AI-2E family transporter [Bacteroidales bacterium]|nr:AI-2E family transporter [Bacteroidales bacterium]
MKTDTTKIIAIILFLTILAAVCWYFSNIIIYLFIALLLSLAGRPIVKLLCKIRIGKLTFPRPLAAIIAMAAMIGIFWGILAVLTPLISQEIKNLTSIDPQVLADGYDRFLSKFESFASRHGLDVTATEISEGIVLQLQGFVRKLDIGFIFSDLVGIIAGVFVAVFAILFLTYFSLSDDGIILKTAKKLFPVKLRNNFDNIVSSTRTQIVHYFGGVFIEMCIVGLINGVACYFLGVPDAVLIGVLSGMLNIIPYLGPLISVCLNVIISCTSMIPMSPAGIDVLYNILKVVATFISAQLIDNFILQPFIYGKSVHAHPLEIFIVIMAAAQIGGVVGMIFAVPVYSLLRIVLKEFFGKYFLDDEENTEAVLDEGTGDRGQVTEKTNSPS